MGDPGDASRWTAGRVALLGAVLAYVACFLAVPFVALAARALGMGLGTLVRELGRREALEGLRMSVLLTLIAVVVNAVVGTMGALVLTRQHFVGRRLLDVLVDLPLAVSPVMTGLAFLLVLGREGWLGGILSSLQWKVVFSFPGLVVGVLFVTLPFTIREVGHVLEELGTSEEESAATLGASRWQTFRLVTLPNIRDGLGFGVTLTAARSLGEFGAVLVLGGAISGKTQTATTFIYAAMEERWETAAYGMALVLAAASMGLLAALEWLKSRRRGR